MPTKVAKIYLQKGGKKSVKTVNKDTQREGKRKRSHLY